MKLGLQLGEALAPLVDLVYPPRCPLCGAAVAAQTGLCSSCWADLEFPGAPSCQKCGAPIYGAGATFDSQCATCMATPPEHAGIVAATRYNDASRTLVLQFKHGRKLALSRMMARMISAQLPQPAHHRDWAIVPVPLHWRRLWQRGFNQSAILAKELAAQGHGQVFVDALDRSKSTPPLGELGRDRRKKVLAGAIRTRLSRVDAVRGKDVLLVDDVVTSGATSDACVAALKEAGARSVALACFARVYA